MDETLHIKIKKDYAANLISDLEAVGAVEFVSDHRNDGIPQWQKDEVLKLKAYYDLHPEELLTWEDLFKELNHKSIKTDQSPQNAVPLPNWIDTELYLYGEIDQEGGIEPNITILTKEYGRLTIAATKQQLQNAGKILYRENGVKVSGKQSLEGGVPFDLRLEGFMEYSPVFDKGELDMLIEKAAPNLSQIENVDDWLVQIRGGV